MGIVAPLKARALPVAALFFLSLLWAVGVLRSIVSVPLGQVPAFEREALPLAAVALIAILWMALRRRPWPHRQFLLRAILIGIGLFVLPALLIHYAAGAMPALGRTALLTLVPVFAVVLEPHLGASSTAARGSLLATMTALTGALCIFPLSLPASADAALAFAAMLFATASIAATNCKAVAMVQADPAMLPELTAVVSATAALALAAISAWLEYPVLRPSLLVDELFWDAIIAVPALLLLFWLMPRLTATQMTTRYLLAPFIAVTVGAGLMRAPLEPRTWLGIILMALGSALLLFPSNRASTHLSLR